MILPCPTALRIHIDILSPCSCWVRTSNKHIPSSAANSTLPSPFLCFILLPSSQPSSPTLLSSSPRCVPCLPRSRCLSLSRLDRDFRFSFEDAIAGAASTLPPQKPIEEKQPPNKARHWGPKYLLISLTIPSRMLQASSFSDHHN